MMPLLEPLPRPHPQDLLGSRLRGVVYDLDLHAERLLYSLLAPTLPPQPSLRTLVAISPLLLSPGS
jgi:hypothetical protein